MRRIAVAVVVLSSVVLSTASPAWGDAQGGGGGATDPWVSVGQPGGTAPGSSTGSGGVHCQYSDANPSTGGNPDVINPIAGKQCLLVCWDSSGQVVFSDFVIYDPAAPPFDPATLARQAYKQLPLVYPDAQTSPSMSMDQVSGVATWLWVPDSEWQPRSATASVLGLSATVTATPQQAVWTMGDGAQVVCDGPGTPYDTSRPDDEQSTDCSHTYWQSSLNQPGERYPASVVIVWSVQWTATDGSGGTLPAAWRGTRFSLRVTEAQALRVSEVHS